MTFFSCKTAKLETKTEQPKTEIITSEFPQKIGFVNDFENIFTEEEIKFLDLKKGPIKIAILLDRVDANFKPINLNIINSK